MRVRVFDLLSESMDEREAWEYPREKWESELEDEFRRAFGIRYVGGGVTLTKVAVADDVDEAFEDVADAVRDLADTLSNTDPEIGGRRLAEKKADEVKEALDMLVDAAGEVGEPSDERAVKSAARDLLASLRDVIVAYRDADEGDFVRALGSVFYEGRMLRRVIEGRFG